MGAASKIRPQSSRVMRSIDLPVKGATALLGGTQVATNASGLAVPVTSAGALRIWGIAQGSQDNTLGADGALTVNIRMSQDLEVWLLNNDTGTPVTAADVGRQIWGLDNQTVTANPTGHSPGPYVYEVTTEGVWVFFETSSTDAAESASSIAVADVAGLFASSDVEGALAELGGYNTTKIQKVTGVLVAGSLTVSTGIVVTANTRVVGINATVRGGTFPAGGYQSLAAGNVVGAAGVGTVVITARAADGTLQNACTDTVAALLVG